MSTRNTSVPRPKVLVIAEKTSLKKTVELLALRFGVSTFISTGVSSLIEVEYLVKALAVGEVDVIAYVDYDPGGAQVARAFVNQLRRYGVTVQSDVQFLVRADCFTVEEKELYALPIPTDTPTLATLAREWVKQTGGIEGKPLGIHADHLRPPERVAQLFASLL